MFRTTLGLGFGTRPGFGRKPLGPRICYRGEGGGGVGITPTQLEMSQAREFQAQLQTYQSQGGVRGERNLFDDVRWMRELRQISYAGSLHALFLVDKNLFCAVMVNAEGQHWEKAEMMAKYPRELRLQMLDCLIWEQTPQVESAHYEIASACAASILSFGYWADNVSQNQAAVGATVTDLYEYTSKKAQLVNQLILALSETGYQLGKFKTIFTEQELNTIVKNLLANPDPAVFSGLSQFSLGFLIRTYGKEFIDKLKQQHKQPGEWKPEWGARPTAEEMAQAEDYYYEVLAQEGGTIRTKLNNLKKDFNGSWKALFYFDQEIFVLVRACSSGDHLDYTKKIGGYPLQLLLAMLNTHIAKVIPQDEDGKYYLPQFAHDLTYALVSVGFYGPSVEGEFEHTLEVCNSLLHLLKYTQKKGQLLNQLILYLNDPLSLQFNKKMVENTVKKLDDLIQYLRNNPDPSIYPQLIPPVIDFLTQKYGADFVAFLKNAKPVAEEGEWKPEWGPRPSDEAIDRARRFCGQKLSRAHVSNAYYDQSVDLRALFYVNPKLTAEVIAYTGRGRHNQLAQQMKQLNAPFLMAVIDQLVLDESPAKLEEAGAAARNMYALAKVVVNLTRMVDVLVSYFKQTDKKRQFVEQFVSAVLLKLEPESANIDGIVSHVLQRCFHTLKDATLGIERDFVWQYLENQFGALLDRKIVAETTWRNEWGPRPSDAAVEKAKDFKASGLRRSDAANAFFESPVDFSALFYVDPQLAIEVIGFCQGRHAQLFEKLNRLSDGLLLEIIDRLVLDQSPQTAEEKNDIAAVNLYSLAKIQANERNDRRIKNLVIEYLKKSPRRSLFVEQLIYSFKYPGLGPNDIFCVSAFAFNVLGKVLYFLETSGQVLEIEKDYALQYLEKEMSQYRAAFGKKQSQTAEWKPKWGPRPSDEEVAAARSFIDKGLRGYKAAKAYVAADNVELRALFYLSPEIAAEAVGLVAGQHSKVSGRLSAETDDFLLALFDQMIMSQVPTEKSEHLKYAKMMESMLIYFYEALEQSGRIKEQSDFFIKLFHLTSKKAMLINQARLMSDHEIRMLLPSILENTILFLSLDLQDKTDHIDVWESLTLDAQAYLESLEVEALMRYLGKKEGKKWKTEWGEVPSQPEIDRARQFMGKWNAAHENAAAALIKAKINVSTIYFLDPAYAIDIIGHAEGNHQSVGRLVASESEAFAFEFLDALIEGDPAHMESFASIIIAMGDRLNKTSGEVLAKHLMQTKKKKQLLQQIHYALTSSTVQGGKLRQAINPWIFELAQLLEPILVWQELEEPTQEFYAQLVKREGVPELLDLLGKAAAEKKEIDPIPFFGDLAKTESEQYQGINYSPKGVELFLKTFPENERSFALEAILKQDEAAGRMLLRSAKGHHVEIAAALSKVSQEILLPVLQREIMAFPTLDPKNQSALSEFYTHNGFGAMKYLIYNGDPSQIKMSPLFNRLSNQAIAKLLQIFHVFCTMESMLGRMLARPLGNALNDLGIGRIAEISSGTSVETAEWLKKSGIIDFGQLLADYAQVKDQLGPDEMFFEGKIYSTSAWEGFKASGIKFSSLGQEQKGIMLRSAKFHGETRALLTPLSDQEIADILDAELSHFAEFNDDAKTRRFMELDGCSLMKIVALLPIERSVAIFNLISPQTTAAIFEQARYFSQTSEYFFNEFVLRLKSADLDRQKIVQVLPLLKEQTSAWVKIKVFGRELDDMEFDRRMRKALENDPDFIAIAKITDLEEARQLAKTDDLYSFAYKYLTARQLLLIRGEKKQADSRELFLLTELAKRIIEIRAPQVLAAGENLRGIKDGAVTAKVVIIDTNDYQQSMDALHHLTPFNLVVIDEHPANDASMSRTAGIITSRNKGDHDHATLRAKDWDIPLASLPAASKFLKALNGKWVAFEVKGKNATIKLATPEQIEQAQKQYGLISVDEAVRDQVEVLADIGAIGEKAGRVGRKAFNLAKLAKIANVPAFSVITTGANHRYLTDNDLYTRIPAILGNYATDDPETLGRKLKQIRELIFDGFVLGDRVQILWSRPLQNIRTSHIIARTSTNLEDLPEFMAAGVYGSYVKPRSLLASATKAAWASYWSESALSYREKYGIDHLEQLPAVIIQEFIEGDASGNMIVSQDQVIVNAVPKLGEGFTSGNVAADEYHFSFAQGKITKIEVRTRDKVAMLDPSGAIVYSNWENNSQVLNPVQIMALADLAKKVFDSESSSQDIEWTIKGSDIYLLQTRPYRH